MQKVTIFGRPGCGFCMRAKDLCDKESLDYKYVDMHAEGISKQDLEKTVGKPVKTVPQIFVGQEHIGGYTEFESWYRNQA